MILGLSEENIKRLQAGMPIKFKADEIGIPNVDVVICAGKTEQELYEQLKTAHSEKKNLNNFRPDFN